MTAYNEHYSVHIVEILHTLSNFLKTFSLYFEDTSNKQKKDK